ncbi:malate dehydrogenase (oxaloacetate-decarboxylating) [Kibdelosporangium banguiense]|uniref:Malate dehydrogenase (Oxaloacetate-decarboxylating) n=1 Tax=Kibdelosporangium banguiense TaxID=1365924 RepID=A0ABS4TWM8_9PSEU|nr:hypothetical protein [Kibdelosporangium banguiense]MBP2328800.1 malate dehydrogenase (oxaloacetate-decarboxylating) [Kibdelosporangium banguiense]
MTSSNRTVAVVSDGSALADQDTPIEPLLHEYSALIRDVAGLPTVVMPFEAGTPRQLHATLGGLPSTVGAVFLPHVAPGHAHVARLAAGETPVVTDHNTAAIALIAALLTTLTRAGRPLTSSRVVIAGANTMPMLSPLLVTAGVGDITTWNRDDAVAFPLHRVAAGSDAVIDLLGGITEAFGTLVEPAVITRDDPRTVLLALPGLLRALTQVPNARLDVEVYHACALALVMATPSDERLPQGPDRALTRQVADAATRTLHQPARHSHDTRSS